LEARTHPEAGVRRAFRVFGNGEDMMRIRLIFGGIYLLAAVPLAAQEASDSTRILAVPHTTPTAPNMQELFTGASHVVSGAVAAPGTIGLTAALLGALCLGLALRFRDQGSLGALGSA
jgi:hypothetical protein